MQGYNKELIDKSAWNTRYSQLPANECATIYYGKFVRSPNFTNKIIAKIKLISY